MFPKSVGKLDQTGNATADWARVVVLIEVLEVRHGTLTVSLNKEHLLDSKQQAYE